MNRIQSAFTPARRRVLAKMGGAVVVTSVPIFAWWAWARNERHEQLEAVRTKVRVPNVQTVDDLMVEECRPGDVIVFDRRWETCAAGPLAALQCLLGRAFLCRDDPAKSQTGRFDHVGIVVPGYAKNKAHELDPSNLLLLEATAGGGVVARSLLTRLEASRSRSVVLLPLAMPAERRNKAATDLPPGLVTTEIIVRESLEKFRDKWIDASEKSEYEKAHSTLGVAGALAYAVGLHTSSPGPTSPSAFLVLLALKEAKIALVTDDKFAKEAKVEDFLRDYRFQDNDVIQLRPGWRFLPPVPLREH